MSEREENLTFELICLEIKVIPLSHIILTPESISEIKLMIQGHLQGQILWSMSFEVA